MDLTACPQPGCHLPAEMFDRTTLESTDGPVEHARLMCLNGHRFFMPTMMLADGAASTRRTAAPANS